SRSGMVRGNLTKRFRRVKLAAAMLALGAAAGAQDPPERRPPDAAPRLPSGPDPPIARASVDERALAHTGPERLACGTAPPLSSWDDPARGIGCGRDRILARYRGIAEASGGRLRVEVDRFEAASERTRGGPARLENVLAILPGTDPALSKTVFLAAGHYDSM